MAAWEQGAEGTDRVRETRHRPQMKHTGRDCGDGCGVVLPVYL